ncbi:hypothetical protein K438DRAFT_1771150 [Mycena galopus ATCC 62051]|nr:hypothetical protein K438DRAFT_1771150 [Mycena galopus ATCC 62051]
MFNCNSASTYTWLVTAINTRYGSGLSTLFGRLTITRPQTGSEIPSMVLKFFERYDEASILTYDQKPSSILCRTLLSTTLRCCVQFGARSVAKYYPNSKVSLKSCMHLYMDASLDILLSTKTSGATPITIMIELEFREDATLLHPDYIELEFN